MNEGIQLLVREAQIGDIDLIADYWLKSDPDFMIQMGVDLDKLPSREEFTEMLTQQIGKPLTEKKAYALIWEMNGKPIGHSNVNGIEFGQEATMHLHIWQSPHRQKGNGTRLLRKSLPFYFDNLALETLICEPYALNPGPNKTLENIGFEWIKRYTTIPGSINFEQEVNRWELTKAAYLNLSQ